MFSQECKSLYMSELDLIINSSKKVNKKKDIKVSVEWYAVTRIYD